ncbi:hypothetical protein AOLI_G00179460 [Acnodon oligacanthus]
MMYKCIAVVWSDSFVHYSDSMLPAWACSVLLLGFVVGSPLYHSETKNSISDDVVPPHPVNSSNTTVDCQGPFCGSAQNYTESENATLSSNGKRMFHPPPPPMIIRLSGTSRKAGCILPTCAVHHLSEKLQAGDESAGDTHDPYGAASARDRVIFYKDVLHVDLMTGTEHRVFQRSCYASE